MATRKRSYRRRKSRRHPRKKQRGGGVTYFHVYVFTKEPLTKEESERILELLKELYGDVEPLKQEEDDWYDMVLRDDITEFVYSKGGHYPSLTTVTGFRIKSIPDALKEGVMNDPKLTDEEYTIRDRLRLKGLPFTLVRAQHGIFNENTAVIALEKTS